MLINVKFNEQKRKLNIGFDENNGDVEIADTSGTIEITIPSDGTLYVGVKSSTNVAHGGYNIACFDGDYIKIKKVR